MISATSQMKELSDRLRQLDVRCKECQDREKQAVKERNDWQQKYEDRLTELQSLTSRWIFFLVLFVHASDYLKFTLILHTAYILF